ncbi:Carboxypeptidase regulatory-like domain-containing protein [Lachnospiraceae bacterium XBB1006]|nr:Carboxypeptidase regulatory-like domain-containing protein [Lachnospiraceae bacterium XBB1006]
MWKFGKKVLAVAMVFMMVATLLPSTTLYTSAAKKVSIKIGTKVTASNNKVTVTAKYLPKGAKIIVKSANGKVLSLSQNKNQANKTIVVKKGGTKKITLFGRKDGKVQVAVIVKNRKGRTIATKKVRVQVNVMPQPEEDETTQESAEESEQTATLTDAEQKIADTSGIDTIWYNKYVNDVVSTPKPTYENKTDVVEVPITTPVPVASETKAVSSGVELVEALRGGTRKITFATTEEVSVEIPEGNYENSELVVDAPQATIVNHAKIGKVYIKSIAEHTWVENAQGTTILVQARNAHIVLQGSNTDIQTIAPDDGMTAVPNANDRLVIDIRNEGAVGTITIDDANNIEVTTDNTNGVGAIDIINNVQNTTLRSNVPVNLTANDHMEVTLDGAASGGASNLSVESRSTRLVINGEGQYNVHNNNSGADMQVFAQNVTTAAQDGNRETVSLSGSVNSAQLTTEGNVESEGALVGARISLIPYHADFNPNNLDAELRSAQAAGKLYTGTIGSDGTCALENVLPGNYIVIYQGPESGEEEFEASYEISSVTSRLQRVSGTVLSRGRGNGNGNGNGDGNAANHRIYGTVVDALHGAAVSGISVYLYRGNNANGMPIKTTTTNSQGSYEFTELTHGSYRIQFLDERAELTHNNQRMSVYEEHIVINAHTQAYCCDVTLSNRLVGNGNVRFVLCWAVKDTEFNLVPSDLDSHLVGPTSYPGEVFHTWYGGRTYFEEDASEESGFLKYADLDRDDTDYEGPETTTIYKMMPGEYHFYIHNFSDRQSHENTKLGTSDAKVTVYRGGEVLAEYSVPQSVKGNFWDVCTYNGQTGELQYIGTVRDESCDESVMGLNELQKERYLLRGQLNRIALENVVLNERMQEAVQQISEKMNNGSVTLEEIRAFKQEYRTYQNQLGQVLSLVERSDRPEGAENIIEIYEDIEFAPYYESGDDSEEISVIVVRTNGNDEVSNDVLTQWFEAQDGTEFSIIDSDREGYDRILVLNNSTLGITKYYYVSICNVENL